MHTVIETQAFGKGAKEIGLSEDDLFNIKVFISENPTAGEIIRGTGGARKLRFPLNNRGKSGGCRVITYYAAEDVPVFLLDIFAKNEKINLTKQERNELKKILADIADGYRDSVKQKTRSVGRA